MSDVDAARALLEQEGYTITPPVKMRWTWVQDGDTLELGEVPYEGGDPQSIAHNRGHLSLQVPNAELWLQAICDVSNGDAEQVVGYGTAHQPATEPSAARGWVASVCDTDWLAAAMMPRSVARLLGWDDCPVCFDGEER